MQNLEQEQDLQNFGMWGGPAVIWNLGPGITAYAGEPVWTLQNLQQGELENLTPIFIPAGVKLIPQAGAAIGVGASILSDKVKGKKKMLI